jgi:hypothetical protein
MKTDHLPRHIQEHVKHCPDCHKRDALCAVGEKLVADHKIVSDRIDKLPKLSSYAKPK